MPKGDTTAEKEHYERARFAVKLLGICTCNWTVLVVAWISIAICIRFADPNSFWASDWLVLAVENLWEAVCKIGYLSILIEVHEQLFDDVSRTAQRLGDLRTYMSAVWDASNDVVVICSCHDSMVNAAVSPSFFQMDKSNKKPKPSIYKDEHDQSKTTLVMEVDPYVGSYRTFEVNLSKKMSREEANTMMKTSRNKARMVTPVFNKNLKALSDLVCDAVTIQVPEGQNQHTILKEFFCENLQTPGTRNLKRLICEAKVVKLQGKTFLIVLRDVTQQVAPEAPPPADQYRDSGGHQEEESLVSGGSSDTDMTTNTTMGRHQEQDRRYSREGAESKNDFKRRNSSNSSKVHSLYSSDDDTNNTDTSSIIRQTFHKREAPAEATPVYKNTNGGRRVGSLPAISDTEFSGSGSSSHARSHAIREVPPESSPPIMATPLESSVAADFGVLLDSNRCEDNGGDIIDESNKTNYYHHPRHQHDGEHLMIDTPKRHPYYNNKNKDPECFPVQPAQCQIM
uniref:Uncharacterized protein n=1 Tax=Entomoneis paludosa TaxID=265537 RepID=A0A7S2YL02_9STRA